MSRIAPDPGLTLAEVLYTMSALKMELSGEGAGDTVITAAYDKLRESANYVSEHAPEEFAAASAQIAMHRRFRGTG